MNDLIKCTSSSEHLTCIIDDYSELDLHPSTAEYYNLIIVNIVAALFNKLFDEKEKLKGLSKEDRLFLSYLLSQYTNQVTQAELMRKIESIQLSPVKKFFKKRINFFRAIFNYGLSAGLNIVKDTLRSYYSYLPPIEESQIREIMPQISLNVETDFNSQETSYGLLLRICSVVFKLGYGKTTVFFDKFDEDSRMENNADTISDFIICLLTDNKLLENPSIQFVVSVWEVPFRRTLDRVRTQKHYCPIISWPLPYLSTALNRRLAVFSKYTISGFDEIVSDDVDEKTIQEIFYLSNGNPRDLWHVIDSIFQAQYSLDPCSSKLSVHAIHLGLSTFVTTFNFYEYYPKKPNAKASTMDIYSYIKHLIKLPTEYFTKNQLNELAKTGSSTNNYVYSMESIGLVVNTNEKQNSGVLYRIADPKIVYAMKNKLDISKN